MLYIYCHNENTILFKAQNKFLELEKLHKNIHGSKFIDN